MSKRPAARQRYIYAAAELFARNGFTATSIADVQQASGVTAGSGALYKHFATKVDLLAAVVDHHIEVMQSGHAAFADHADASMRDVLTWTATAVRSALRRDANALRVMLRDLDDHPQLRERMWRQVRTNVYDAFSQWVQTQAELGRVNVGDVEATSAVLMASLTAYPILESLVAHAPGDVAVRKYLGAWVDSAMATLGVTPA